MGFPQTSPLGQEYSPNPEIEQTLWMDGSQGQVFPTTGSGVNRHILYWYPLYRWRPIVEKSKNTNITKTPTFANSGIENIKDSIRFFRPKQSIRKSKKSYFERYWWFWGVSKASAISISHWFLPHFHWILANQISQLPNLYNATRF
jgi:hypothetical protein